MAASDEARRLLAKAAEDEDVLDRYEGEAEADEEELARREVREQLRGLRQWVEARLSAATE